jgi:D-alanyl-lipoteichoic acid acyltransferase DltB (MBOAT superfamily)
MAGEMGDGGFVALVAVYGFAIQIYCDFSGYSDIASGIALLMGFRQPDNFNAPYKSATITEFWRRWHISLSTWLRDYLYISLGGNRKGKVRTYLNLVITMFLGGLWHGGSLTFMLWGLFHGVALALHKLWLAYVPGAKTAGEQMRPVWRSLGMVLTFHIVCFGWLLFMADDMAQVEQVLHNIAFNFSFDEIVPVIETSVVAFAVLGLGFLMHFLPQRVNDGFMYAASRSGVVGQAMVLVAVVWLSMQCDMLLAANSVTPDNLPMYASY